MDTKLNDKNKNPGPGDYENFKSRNHVKAAIFSKRSELDLVKHGKDSPGPGKYEMYSTVTKENTFTLGSKHKRIDKTDTPGPGAYNPIDVKSIENTYAKGSSRNTQFKIKRNSVTNEYQDLLYK